MSASRSNRLERRRLALALEQIADQAPDLGLGIFSFDAGQPLEIQPAQQFLVNPSLERLILRVPHIGRLPRGGGEFGRQRFED